MQPVHIKEGAGDAPAPAEADTEGDSGADTEEGGDAKSDKKDKKGGKAKPKEEPMKLFGAIIPGLRGATMFKWADALSGEEM